ncbi:helix-turn-helix domain-containing protein [Streptomyces sp. NPDC059788]|uniref:helix-turn-helix domain-containing protein n=1 Tax=Streptomyces sp. NPDC059788 TaxID=3346948 RepID=UPI0036634C98
MERSQTPQGNRMSTVLGRRLGGELAKHRLEAGLTQGQAAKVISASTGKVARMESGWVPMRDPDIRILCELYEVTDPAAVGGLLELARVDRERRKAKGWWNDFPGLGAMKEYVALESAATAIKTWQVAYVPGLLQCEAYIRALKPDDNFVAARLARQQRLDDEPRLHLHAVVYEAALRNLIGGADVMREQLEYLADASEKPNVSVRVLPFSAGAQVGIGCGYNVLSFTEPGAMDVVYIEIPRTQVWIEGGDEATEHDEMFERIAGEALDEPASRTFIRSLSKDL